MPIDTIHVVEQLEANVRARHARDKSFVAREGEKEADYRAKETLLLRYGSILPSSITRPRVYLVICRETGDSRKASHAAGTINLCPANQACPRDRSSSPVERLRGLSHARRKGKDRGVRNTFADVKRRAGGQPCAYVSAREANRNIYPDRRRVPTFQTTLCTQTLNST